jgi:hypothetical protein
MKERRVTVGEQRESKREQDRQQKGGSSVTSIARYSIAAEIKKRSLLSICPSTVNALPADIPIHISFPQIFGQPRPPRVRVTGVPPCRTVYSMPRL